MENRHYRISAVALLLLGLVVIFSCKQEVSQPPEFYDAEYDGLAVNPLPPIDIGVLNAGVTIPSHRSTAAFEGTLSQPTIAPAGSLGAGTFDPNAPAGAPFAFDPNGA